MTTTRETWVHHPYGPSQLGKRAACPGSARMEEGLPDIPSPEAEEGTALHAILAEQKIREDLSSEDEALLGRAHSFLASHVPENFHRVFREERAHLHDPETGEIVTSGTIDYYALHEEGATLIDWKFGRLEPWESAVRWQLEAYAAMVLERHPGIHRVQAYAYFVRSGEYLSVVLEDWQPVALAIAHMERTQAGPGLLLNPSPDACRYCRALPYCPAPQRMPDMPSVRDLVIQRAPPHEWKRRLEVAKFVERWARLVQVAAKTELEEGRAIPGWELLERPGARYVAKPLDVWKATRGLLTDKDFMALVELPIGALEEALIEAFLREGEATTKKDARELARGILEQVVSYRPAVHVLQKEKFHGIQSTHEITAVRSLASSGPDPD